MCSIFIKIFSSGGNNNGWKDAASISDFILKLIKYICASDQDEFEAEKNWKYLDGFLRDLSQHGGGHLRWATSIAVSSAIEASAIAETEFAVFPEAYLRLLRYVEIDDLFEDVSGEHFHRSLYRSMNYIELLGKGGAVRSGAIEKFLHYTATFDELESLGYSCLHFAAYAGFEAVVRLLVEAAAGNYRDLDGKVDLGLLCTGPEGREAIVQEIMVKGAAMRKVAKAADSSRDNPSRLAKPGERPWRSQE